MTHEITPAALAELEQAERASCADCRRAYGDAHGFPDLVVPHDAWERIMPGRQGGGLLCPSCMCKRAHDVGLSDVPAKFTSGPFAARHAHAQAEEIERLKVSQPDRPVAHQGPQFRTIPRWLAEEAYAVYAQRFGFAQSLDRVLERGGFSDAELDIFVQGWRGRLSRVDALTAQLTAQAARMRALEAVAAAATAHIAAMDPIDQGTTLVDIASALDALASEAKRGEGTTP